MQQNSFSYPAMLDLKNKKCVIIGGGKVAVRKALPFVFSQMLCKDSQIQ